MMKNRDEEVKPELKDWETNPAIPSWEGGLAYVPCKNEEESALEVETVSGKIPTEEDERYSRIFCNRLMICILAISLLWVTSLQIAIGIVDTYISAPSMNAVIVSCENSYNILSDEKDAFGECVARQLEDCNTELTTAYTEENARVTSYQAYNAEILLTLQTRLASLCDPPFLLICLQTKM